MRIVGLDLSLTATGIATDTRTVTVAPTRLKLTGAARLAWLRDTIAEHCTNVNLAVLEGYAYGSKHAREALGELGGVIRVMLWDRQIPTTVIPPATLKQYATGNGNATKQAMVLAAQRHLDYKGTDHNCADAMWLAAAARDHYRIASHTLPASQRDVLRTIKWPPIHTTR